jgi:protein SCO1/2
MKISSVVLPVPVLRSSLVAGALSFAMLASASCGPSDEVARVASRMTAIESGRPFTLPDQSLLAHTGDAFNLRSGTAGRFALLFFGYTYCPDICPIQLATANAALGQLTDAERGRAVVLFVTVDPQRDTPERLAEWMGGLRSRAIGLRGSTGELEQLVSSMGFVMPPMTSRQPIEGGGPDAYLVPHPTSLFLVTPDGTGRFQYPYGGATPAQIAGDLRMLMELDWSGVPEARAMEERTEPVQLHAVSESTLGRTVAGPLTVRDARIPANPRARSLALYAEIENAGEDDALVGFQTDIAEVGIVHVVEERNGLASMRTATELSLPGGASVSLRSGEQHGMLMELLDIPAEGDTVEVIFLFASGAEITVQVPVVSLASMVPGG